MISRLNLASDPFRNRALPWTLAAAVSAVVFLNSQSDDSSPDTYRGGTLVFHPRGAAEPLRFKGSAGTLVLFRAETTHEVEPVTRGERFTIASWYR